jgi:adenylate cyclase
MSVKEERLNQAYLVMQTESGDRHLQLVGSNWWTFGRCNDNNFMLSDRWVSRYHAMLQCYETNQFFLIDLGSRNGTFVNGRRVIMPVTLRDGDRLAFGKTELEFHSSSSNSHSSTDECFYVMRLMSVMVVDIRDCTRLTHQVDEKILSRLIGTWFRHAGNIIRHSGGWVDKYIGDAVMGIWFHRLQGMSHEDAMNIFKAVSGLHKMTRELSKQYPLPFPLQIGTGINTGYARGGFTDSGDRLNYMAIGDTVDAAFCLESTTKQIGLDIALGEATYQYLSGLGNHEIAFKQHTLNLKDYDFPFVTYAGNYADLENFLQAGSSLPVTCEF